MPGPGFTFDLKNTMKKLSQMSTEDVKKELSIAGSPDKLIVMMGEIGDIMSKVDQTNVAELINLEFILHRLQAEVRVWKKKYEERTGQKIR
jgi:hypothetical protein